MKAALGLDGLTFGLLATAELICLLVLGCTGFVTSYRRHDPTRQARFSVVGLAVGAVTLAVMALFFCAYFNVRIGEESTLPVLCFAVVGGLLTVAFIWAGKALGKEVAQK